VAGKASGVALVMCRRLCCISSSRLKALEREVSIPLVFHCSIGFFTFFTWLVKQSLGVVVVVGDGSSNSSTGAPVFTVYFNSVFGSQCYSKMDQFLGLTNN